MDRYLEIGVDVVDIELFKQKLSIGSHSFLKKVFSLKEQSYCKQFSDPLHHYAGLYAAKEATYKALNKIIHVPLWKIEISHADSGQPKISLPIVKNIHQHGIKLGSSVSISHDKTKVIAFVIIFDLRVANEQIHRAFTQSTILGQIIDV